MPGGVRAKDRVVEGVAERFCNKCREWVWIEEFCKNRTCTEGRTSECRICRNERRSAEIRARAIRNGWVALRELRETDRARRREERDARRDRDTVVLNRDRKGRFSAA
jgi:hypothetical protein